MHTYVSHVLFMFGLLCNYALRADFLASRFFSRLDTTIQQLASPVILTTVRPISKILSTPATRAIPSTGRPTEVRTMASMTIPAPGTPAVPMEASVAVRTKNNGEHLGRRQCDAVTGSDEDRTDTLINGCTVHVDGCTQRQNKRRNLSGSTKSFHTFQVDRKCSHGRRTGEGKHHCRKHAFEELQWA